MKQLSTKLLLAVLMSMASVSVLAYDVAEKNTSGVMIYYKYINDGKELEVVGAFDGIVYTGRVDIPEKAAGLDVTTIGKAAFAYCTELASVTIPNSVTVIDEMAFYNCVSLNNIVIPKSVTYIAPGAFEGNGLTFISVEEGNPAYDSRKSNAIIEIVSNTLIVGCCKTTIPNTVTAIGESAFSGVREITTEDIPESVTCIGAGAFSGCQDLTDMTIPKSVIYIGPYAFRKCVSLTSISISGSLDSISGGTFADCYKLGSVTIPNSVTSIGEGAFVNCTSLFSITIPNEVTCIGSAAFRGCECLTSINLPDNLTSINPFIIDGTGITEITIPSSVAQMHAKAFPHNDLKTVVSLIEEPFELPIIKTKNDIYETFSDITFEEAILYIPTGTIDKYKSLEGWNNFKNIVELDPSGIRKTIIDEQENSPVYDLNGRRLSHSSKGINIIGGKKYVMK